MSVLINSILVIGGMGLIAGIILAFFSKKLAVQHDPKVKELIKKLPGLNCGGCGYANCHAYATAILQGKAELNLCKPGGQKTAELISEFLDKETEVKEALVAQRYCNGGTKETKLKFKYSGIKTCKQATLINNGFKECGYSCLGFGDCEIVCPVDAIRMSVNDLPMINKEKCIGCEKCVIECPRNILHMAPKKAKVHVRCSSNDPGKIVTKVCTVGCIACKKCENECPHDAIHVKDNLAVIDYSKCTNCGKCVEVCPRKIIEMET